MPGLDELPDIVELGLRSLVERVFTHVAGGLASLASAPDGATALLSAGVLPVLLEALRNVCAGPAYAAACALANLTATASDREELLAAVPLLVRCLH